jgi:hypothetical protein
LTTLNQKLSMLVDALHDFKAEEAVEGHRLGDVTVGMESISSQDIRVRRRGRQDYRNAFQCRALLDVLQNLPAVFLGQVQIKIRSGRGALAGSPSRFRKFIASAPFGRHVQACKLIS